MATRARVARNSQMVSGAHTVIYSADPEPNRTFLHDVFKLTHVAGTDSWPISAFAFSPAEVLVHPSDRAHTDPMNP